jgi:flagellar biosynthesis anti-sigma factor FlgM
MTKIDTNRLTQQDIDATKSAEAAKKIADTRAAKKNDMPAAVATDTVQVSADAKLFVAAVKEASAPAPVRAELVEAMKQKLAAGEIGKDSGRLADRIIDDLLKE